MQRVCLMKQKQEPLSPMRSCDGIRPFEGPGRKRKKSVLNFGKAFQEYKKARKIVKR